MGVKKPEWRQNIVVDPKVRRKLLKLGVLKSLESCLGFLEDLKRKGEMDSPEWNVADKAYNRYLDEKVEEKVDVREFTERYYKMFRIQYKHPVVRVGESFNGEFRFTHHIQHPTEYSLTGEEGSK